VHSGRPIGRKPSQEGNPWGSTVAAGGMVMKKVLSAKREEEGGPLMASIAGSECLKVLSASRGRGGGRSSERR
jgi:hypothetical protein